MGLLAWLRKDATIIRTQIEAYEAGRWRSGIKVGGAYVDTTADDLNRRREILTSIEDTIGELEEGEC